MLPPGGCEALPGKALRFINQPAVSLAPICSSNTLTAHFYHCYLERSRANPCNLPYYKIPLGILIIYIPKTVAYPQPIILSITFLMIDSVYLSQSE